MGGLARRALVVDAASQKAALGYWATLANHRGVVARGLEEVRVDLPLPHGLVWDLE